MLLSGQSVEISVGGKMLAEGNLFKDIQPINPDQTKTEIGGQAYVPFTAAEANACQPSLGRPCVANLETADNAKGPVGPFQFGKTLGVLRDFMVNQLICFP